MHYGTPSYWVLKFFRESSGATLLDAKLQTNSSSLVASAITWTNSVDGETYLKIKVWKLLAWTWVPCITSIACCHVLPTNSTDSTGRQQTWTLCKFWVLRVSVWLFCQVLTSRQMYFQIVNFGNRHVSLKVSVDGLGLNSQLSGSTKTVLTSSNVMDENSFTDPNKVSDIFIVNSRILIHLRTVQCQFITSYSKSSTFVFTPWWMPSCLPVPASSRYAGGARPQSAWECWQRHEHYNRSIFFDFTWFINRIKQYQDATNRFFG